MTIPSKLPHLQSLADELVPELEVRAARVEYMTGPTVEVFNDGAGAAIMGNGWRILPGRNSVPARAWEREKRVKCRGRGMELCFEGSETRRTR